MGLLLDSISLTPELTEKVKETPSGRLIVTGKFQHCDVVNRNNRIYPRPVWARHLTEDADFMKAIKSRQVFGHLEHPPDGKSNLKEAAIVITGLHLREDGQIWGTLETLRTESGKIAKALILDGLSVGISSRAEGSVKTRTDGVAEVQEDFVPKTFDLVADPSTPGALLHEELQKKLGEKTPEAIQQGEWAAKCEVQLDALKEQTLVESWDPTWTSRLNDAKYIIKRLDEGEVKSRLNDLYTLINEGVAYKKKLHEQPKTEKKVEEKTSTYRTILVEQAEKDAGEAQMAADKAEKAAAKAAEVSAEGAGSPELEVAVAQAKISAGEAEAALAAAKAATSDAGVEAAATAAADAAEKAKAAAEKAAEIIAPEAAPKMAEEEVPPAEPMPEEPMEMPEEPVSDEKVYYTVKVKIDCERLSDPTKKKINVFRPGEDLETLQTLIGSALEEKGLPVKSLELTWLDDAICCKVEVDGDPELAKQCIKELVHMNNNTETMPAEGVFRSQARGQVISELQEEISALRDRIARLQTENKNLRILNQEMVQLFEAKVIQYETKAILHKNPELAKMEHLLLRNRNIKALHEMAEELRRALKGKKRTSVTGTDPRSYLRGVKESNTCGSQDIKDGLPPITLEEETRTSGPVADGTPESVPPADPCSRLAAYRKRKEGK